MNRRSKDLFKYHLLQKVKHRSKNGTRVGCSKCYKGISYKHYRVMSDIVWKLVQDDFEVYTEVEFTTKGRADILAIKEGMAYIIEVLNSETEEMFLSKKNYYPMECEIIPIKVNDFDLDSFAL